MQSLDSARCTGHWHEVPELARKVDKHAPHRKSIPTSFKRCPIFTDQPPALTLVARAEATISTTEVSELDTNLAPLIKPLQDTIEKDTTHPEDVFQATVCLGWIYWLLQEPKKAAEVMNRDPSDILSKASNQWVFVCASKQAFLKGDRCRRLHVMQLYSLMTRLLSGKDWRYYSCRTDLPICHIPSSNHLDYIFCFTTSRVSSMDRKIIMSICCSQF